MLYRLFYWPGIQGRGEYVRLALEEARAEYVDIALLPEKRGGGVAALMRVLDDRKMTRPPFAPPFLQAGRQWIGQTANILQFLGPRLRLVPRDEGTRLWVHQLQLTMADFVVEIHDTHHPLGGGLYYEQQKPEARRRSKEFLAERVPKYLRYFERVVRSNNAAGHWLVGRRLSYADLSMAQIIAGLHYAFPRTMRTRMWGYPRLRTLHEAVFARPNIRRYMNSGRRLAFNEEGIFRHYPELDRQARSMR